MVVHNAKFDFGFLNLISFVIRCLELTGSENLNNIILNLLFDVMFHLVRRGKVMNPYKIPLVLLLFFLFAEFGLQKATIIADAC